MIVNTLKAREYLLLYFIYKGDYNIIQDYIKSVDKFTLEDFTSLKDKGFIVLNNKERGIFLEDVQLTDKSISIFKTDIVEKLNVSNWIDDWYNLFPSKVRSGGYPVKTDKKGCLKKMIKFCDNNPEYSKEIIFKATEFYINSAREKEYQYMKLAPYFIEKDGVSMLAGECDNIIDRIKNNEKTTINKISTNIKSV